MATLKDLLVSGPTRVIGNITGKSFIKEGGTSSQFLKADGSVDSSSYSLSNHTHTLSVETSNDASQITLTHNTKFKISAGGSSYVFTTPSLPFASNTVTGITKLGAAGGAATFDHEHGTIQNDGSVDTNTAIQSGDCLLITDASDKNKIKNTSITFGSSTTTYLRNDGTWGTPSGGSGGGSTVSANNITLSTSAQTYVTVNGTSKTIKLPDTCPWDIDTNTTYTIATGDSNGQIKVTPSSGSAYNVSVKGLGSAAYTESSAYATSGHTHTLSVETSNDASQITLTHNTKFKISAGGSSYVFTTPSLPFASTTVTGITKLGAAGGAATFDHEHGTIQNDGSVDTNTAIQSGDCLLITDASDKNKIKNTSITFGSSTTTYLRNDGTWGTPSGGSGGGSTVSANNITLSTSAQTYVTVNGTSKTIKLPDTCPWDIDTNTTYTIATGDSNGQIKVTPSSGSAYNVSVKGLGSAAYTESSAYATSGHTHTLSVETSNDASQITLTHNTKFKISAGGSSYVFTTPSLPFASNTVTGITKVGATGGAATFDHGHGTIKNDGSVATNTAIQSGDRLLITDASDKNKIKNTSITFGTSTTTYLRNDGTWGTPSGGSGGGAAQLPVTLFEDDVDVTGTIGSVIPIAKTSDEVKVSGSYSNIIKTVPTLIFPKTFEAESFALPIYMDGKGRLFTLISRMFADFLIKEYGFTEMVDF